MDRNLDPSSRPFPLLSLPPELRNMIYRHLLVFPHVIDRYGQYRMHPEILLVNKQISAEAERVLDENYFVVLELDRKARGGRNWFYKPLDVPRIHNMSARPGSFVSPLLWIRLREDITGNQSPEEMEARDNDTVLYLMGPEAISHIIDLLWDNAFLHNADEGATLPLSSMTLELTLTNERFPNKQVEIVEFLLAPFQLVTFRDVNVFIATAGNTNASAISRPMNIFPAPAEVRRRMRGLMAKGQESYDAGEYTDACQWWYRFERYRAWISTIVTSDTLAGNLPAIYRPLVRTLQNTFPLLLQAFLGQTKALLHLEEWEAAYNLAMDVTWYVGQFFGGFNVYYSKFMLCISIARGGRERDRGLGTKQEWLDDLLQLMVPLMRETQYAVLLPRVLKEYYWAMEVFPEGSENLRYFSTRRYWDLLEVKDSSLLPTTRNTWLSRRDARRELDYKRELRMVTRANYGY